jgi:hypothetical protein
MTTVCAWENTVVMAKQPSGLGQSAFIHRWATNGHTRALDVHKVRVGRLHKSLELVLLLLVFGRGVKEINCESLGKQMS